MIERRQAALPATCLLGLALISAPATAQQRAPVVDPNTPPGWVVTPTIAVGQTFDSNVSLNPHGTGIIDDYLTAVSPSLGLGYRGRRTDFEALYLGSYDFYREVSQFDAANQRANIELKQRLSRRLNLFARDNLAITPTTEDLATGVAPVVLRRRTTRFNDFRGGVETVFSSKTTLSTAYTSQWITFARDEEVAPLLRGGHSHGAEVTLRRALTPHVALSGDYTYQRAIVNNGGDQFDVQNAGATLDVELSRSFSAFAEGGYAWLSPGREQPRHDAPTFRVGLGWQHPRANWDVQYGRAFLPSFGFGGSVQNEELAGTLRVPFNPRVTLTARASVRENDPLRNAGVVPPPTVIEGLGVPLSGTSANLPLVAPTELPPSGLDTSLRSISAQTSLVFLATRWLRLEIYGSHSFQDSQVAGGQISRTRAGVQVSTSRSMRVR